MSDEWREPHDEPVPSEPRPAPAGNPRRSIILIAVVFYLLLACMLVAVALAVAYRVSSGQ